MAEGVKRKISAIVSADVVGYSKLMEADEESTVRTVKSYRRTITSLIEQHDGRVIDSPGDNILSEFGSVVDAVQCAVEIQHIIRAKNAGLPEARRMQFRIGINLGDVIEEEGRIYGEGINVAARIEGIAHPGGICISRTAYDQIVSKLHLDYEDLGERSVKNIERPVQVYRIPMGAHRTPAAVGDGHQSLEEKPSIAVLPFDNMSGDPEQEYFADGIVEEIIARLSMNSSLAVKSRNSTFSYKGTHTKSTDIGNELEARYVVEGSVRKAGNQVRITAQLIDATTDNHLWVKTYNRELRDIFSLQDEIAELIAASLDSEYTEAELRRVRRIPTDDLTAYDTYLRGVDQFHKLSVQEGIALLKRAIELDPEFPDAYAHLAHIVIGGYGIGMHTDMPGFEEAVEYARRAIQIDDSIVVAHVALAQAYRFTDQYDQALTEIERAISLNPSNALSYIVKGAIYNSLKRSAEAIEVLEKAMNCDPLHDAWCMSELGWAHRDLGNYKESVAALREALSRSPNHPMPYWELVITYRRSGDHEKAIETVEEAISRDIGLPEWVFATPAQIHREFGRHEKALSWLKEVISRYPDSLLLLAELAITYREMDEYGKAIALLESGIAKNPEWGMGHWHLSETYQALGEFGKSTASLMEIVANQQETPQVYEALAINYLSEFMALKTDDPNTLDLAQEMVDRCIELDEGYTGGYFTVGACHVHKDEHEEAIAKAEELIASSPDDPSGYALLAFVYDSLGRVDEAVEMIEKATPLWHEIPVWFLNAMGRAYRLSGNQAEAITAFEKACGPGTPFLAAYQAHLGLAIVYAEMDRIDEAKAEAEEILRLVPNFSVEVFGDRMPCKSRAQAERDMAALRKAGLK